MSRLRPTVLAPVSGALIGLGSAVLLQQFAVRPLDAAGLLVAPAVVAVAGWVVVRRVQRARGGSS